MIDSGSATAVRCRKDPTPRPLTTTIASTPTGGTVTSPTTVSRGTTPNIVYTITFSSLLNAGLTQGQIVTTNTGSCVFGTTTPNLVYTLTCTPTTNGVVSIQVPQAAVTASIGAFPNVPNQLGQSTFINSQP